MWKGWGIIDFANAFSDEPVEKIQEFTYKVENDSILYMQENGESEFEKWDKCDNFHIKVKM